MIAATVLLTGLTSGLLASSGSLPNSSQSVPSDGNVLTINVGAYTNSQCTTNCTSINWSTVAPGNTTTKTIYIKNTGTTSVSLSLTSSNWSPTNAGSFITLSWNKEDSILAPGNSTAATLSLYVSQSITGITTFSFTVVIIGTQV